LEGGGKVESVSGSRDAILNYTYQRGTTGKCWVGDKTLISSRRKGRKIWGENKGMEAVGKVQSRGEKGGRGGKRSKKTCDMESLHQRKASSIGNERLKLQKFLEKGGLGGLKMGGRKVVLPIILRRDTTPKPREDRKNKNWSWDKRGTDSP